MKRIFSDMMGREIEINFPPRRIISVVPSQTELLYDLGLENEVVGITKFCVHPESWFRTKERIGGTKKLNIEKIRSLQPDLIIANKEENEQAQIEELAKEFPVWISDIQTLPQALQMMQVVGLITGTEHKANEIVDEIVTGFTNLHTASQPKRVAYFIWYNPWMTVGGDTFISSMIKTIGWQNVYVGATRYPEVDLQDLKEKDPELVLLSSEPYPFKEKHIEEIKAELPNADVRLVDGEMFSWYGSRMREAIAYMQNLVK
ncbi:MAG: cobalamin-binding protein [Bacteroidetes bacterium 43-93]|nr:ABC transporter substrate-binding protein [Bacteroidota bacterium]OJW96868.1 MAG: cobalamin-binding protein [Bacteroidetes bacterium 43-93]